MTDQASTALPVAQTKRLPPPAFGHGETSFPSFVWVAAGLQSSERTVSWTRLARPDNDHRVANSTAIDSGKFDSPMVFEIREIISAKSMQMPAQSLKRRAVLAILDQWLAEVPSADDERELESLKASLDSHRESDRRLFSS